MLHARKKGESFGLAMCEALKMGKPVFSWQGGEDQNHAAILKNTGWLYRNARDLDDLIEMLQDQRGTLGDQAASLVEEFTPKKVAEKFRFEFGV
jgi:glycosyltransferase involved in cell wall biosynthesis